MGVTVSVVALLLTVFFITFSKYPDALESKNLKFSKLASYYSVLDPLPLCYLITTDTTKRNGNPVIMPKQDTTKYQHILVIDRTFSTIKEDTSKLTPLNNYLDNKLPFISILSNSDERKLLKGKLLTFILDRIYKDSTVKNDVDILYYDGNDSFKHKIIDKASCVNDADFMNKVFPIELYVNTSGQKTDINDIIMKIWSIVNSNSNEFVISIFSDFLHETNTLTAYDIIKLTEKNNIEQINLIYCVLKNKSNVQESNSLITLFHACLGGIINVIPITTTKYKSKDQREFERIQTDFENDMEEVTNIIFNNLTPIYFSYPTKNNKNVYVSNVELEYDKDFLELEDCYWKFVTHPYSNSETENHNFLLSYHYDMLSIRDHKTRFEQPFFVDDHYIRNTLNKSFLRLSVENECINPNIKNRIYLKQFITTKSGEKYIVINKCKFVEVNLEGNYIANMRWTLNAVYVMLIIGLLAGNFLVIHDFIHFYSRRIRPAIATPYEKWCWTVGILLLSGIYGFLIYFVW